MIQFDEHIFQMGWFNHQLENIPNKTPDRGMEKGALQSSAHRQPWERLPKDVGTHSGPSLWGNPRGFHPVGFGEGGKWGEGNGSSFSFS